MKDIFREIWEIRGLIDKAISAQDIALFNKARDRFNLIYQNELHLKTLACATAGREYETEEEFDHDRASNFAMIAYDLNRTRKEVLGVEDQKMKNIQFSSPLEVLWYSRDMYDTAVTAAAMKTAEKENIDNLFEAVNINLSEIIEIYQEVFDKSLIKEKVTLRLIKKEVEDKYFELFASKLELNETEM